MSLTVQTEAANGYLSIALPENDLAQSLTIDGNGMPSSVSVVYWGKINPYTTVNNVTYTKTFTRNGAGVLINTSRWVPQL